MIRPLCKGMACCNCVLMLSTPTSIQFTTPSAITLSMRAQLAPGFFQEPCPV